MFHKRDKTFKLNKELFIKNAAVFFYINTYTILYCSKNNYYYYLNSILIDYCLDDNVINSDIMGIN